MGFFSKPEVIGPGGDDDRKSRLIAEFEQNVDVHVEDRVDQLEQRVARLEALPI